MLYRREAWCLGEDEMAILRKTKTAMCGAIPIEKRRNQARMDSRSLEEASDGPTKVCRVRWYGPVLRDGDKVMQRALNVEVVGRQERGEPKIKRRQV